jgi:trimeric autotransporter adhesin
MHYPRVLTMTSFSRDLSKVPSHDIWEGTYYPKPTGGNSLDRLIERKQMSTKTTFKRIALVTVAALGFGVLTSLSPASAVLGDATTGFSISKTSVTVVGANTGAAVFRIQLANSNAAAALAGVPTEQSLQSDETLTVSVVGVPTGVTATKSVTLSAADLVITSGTVGTLGQPYSVWTETIASGVIAPSTAAVVDSLAIGAIARSYYVRVAQNAALALDQGTYTIRFRLVKGSLLVKETTAKVTFVSSAVDSGAVLTVARTGSSYVGSTGSIATYSATNNIKATIADVNGGQIINADRSAPDLTLDTVSSTGTTALVNGTLALVDGGSAADFGYAVQDAAVAGSASPTNLGFNGTYGGTWSVPALASETNRLRVRYGSSVAYATSVVFPTSTAATGTATVSGTGVIAGATAGTWTAPLTATSAKYTVSLLTAGPVAVQDEPVTITVTWSGSVNAGDVTPVSGTDGTQIIKTDSNGRASITLTNSAPIDGAVATITATGTGATVTQQVITWAKAKSASVLVSPNASYKAALKSANTVTFTFLDSFGVPVVGDLIALSIAGANNALGTVVIPSVKTDANGQVSYTWTDAAALTTEADAITATSTSVAAATATRTVTYLTTVPVIATLTGKFDRSVDGSLAYPDVVPATVIYTVNGGSTKLSINTKMNTAKSLVATSGNGDQVAFQYTAKDAAGVVTGVPVTVAISAGGHILGADGKPVSSLIIYPATGGLVNFVVTATTPGTKTITVTAGTVSATASVAYKNADTDARVLSAVADSNGVVTATVKDAFGNVVAGVILSGSLTSGAEFGNRSNSISVTTATDGTVSFSVLGTGTLTLATASAFGATSYLAGYSDAIGATVQTDAPAGVGSVTLAVAGAAANDVAQAATDAAAEATDAANAATDAANAAAEAADAATAAAQDAADAVAALSTQVSEMVNALKKQITALTNLVIKIQKKVKA